MWIQFSLDSPEHRQALYRSRQSLINKLKAKLQNKSVRISPFLFRFLFPFRILLEESGFADLAEVLGKFMHRFVAVEILRWKHHHFEEWEGFEMTKFQGTVQQHSNRQAVPVVLSRRWMWPCELLNWENTLPEGSGRPVRELRWIHQLRQTEKKLVAIRFGWPDEGFHGSLCEDSGQAGCLYGALESQIGPHSDHFPLEKNLAFCAKGLWSQRVDDALCSQFEASLPMRWMSQRLLWLWGRLFINHLSQIAARSVTAGHWNKGGMFLGF